MKPILFSTLMVRAILEGRKSQTRRIVPEKIVDQYYEYDDWCSSVMPTDIPCSREYEKDCFLRQTRYQRGDILWVRETWLPSPRPDITDYKYIYRADKADTIAEIIRWKPSIFMPREAARLFLEVTNMRVERVQDISEEDAIAEGVIPDLATDHPKGVYYTAYKSLWNSINGKGSWESNPWVWVYEFKRVEL